MRSAIRLWVAAWGLALSSLPALSQELSYGPSVLQLLTPDPFALLRAVTVPPLPPSRAPAPASVPPMPPPPRSLLDALIAAQARANNVPEALVHRVVKQESRYNPRAVGLHGAMGLMQIKHATARALGYTGPPAGLLDPATNLTYAVRYLAGAFRAAEGNAERAYALYRSGYYTSKRSTLARAQHRAAPLRPDADTWGLHGGQ